MLTVGSKVPAFALPGIWPDGTERTVTLEDLLQEGKSLVLYFYPKDDTPGCTTEACDFRDLWQAKAAGATVVGVSPDSIASHRKFQAKYGLNFPLLSDADKTLMTQMGSWGEKTLYGKKTTGVIRSTFVIGPDGTVKELWKSVKVAGHAARVLEKV